MIGRPYGGCGKCLVGAMTIRDQVAAEVTTAERERTDVMRAAMAAVADCFGRREPRLLARQMWRR